MNRAIILAAVLAAGCTSADSPTHPVAAATEGADAKVRTTKIDGGSVQVRLQFSDNILLNEESTLRREWVAVHDDELPVDLEGTPGVLTVPGFSASGARRYLYESSYTIKVTEPVVAVEVRFILFDVWGERTRVLSATDVRDFAVGVYELDGTWSLFSTNEASEHYASIAYVATVRTATGEVYRADSAAVISVAQEYMSDFTDDLLEEEPPNQGD